MVEVEEVVGIQVVEVEEVEDIRLVAVLMMVVVVGGLLDLQRRKQLLSQSREAF